MLNNKIILGAVSGVLFISCGGSGGDSPSKKSNVQALTTLSTSPVEMTKASRKCTGVPFAMSGEKKIGINMYSEEISGKGRYVLDFSDQIKNNIIKSQSGAPVANTSYGKKTEVKYLAKYDEFYSRYNQSILSADVTKSPSDLDICPSDDEFDSYTLEGAGLSWSHSVTKTYKAVKNVLPSLVISPITMNIVPLNKTVIQFRGGEYDNIDYTAYQTDNAYYSPSEKSLNMLPQSQEQFDAGNLPFWEIPMVASHEYGHHIFQTLALDKLQSNNQTIHNCFETEQTHAHVSKEYHKAFNINLGGLRGSFKDFILGSINEGFADLIAYYTLDKDERSVNGVGCFIGSRDVSSPYFGNGAHKSFTKANSKIMDSFMAVESDSNCKTPDFQEIHQVGAVFARVVESYLDSLSLTKEQKLKVILQYAQKLGSLDQLPTEIPSKFMLYSMEVMAKFAKSLKGEVATSDDCLFIMGTYFNGTFLGRSSCMVLLPEW